VVEADGYRVADREWRPSADVIPATEAELVAPVKPRQVLAIGLNYRGHATESGMAIPSAPQMFVKTPNTVIGPGAPVVLPAIAPDEVDYEAELVIVMGKDARHVSEGEAAGFILGYTCGNDVSARDCQLKQDVQWARGKCFDTFAPIGPWIETDIDPDDLSIRLKLNGETMQESSTSDLIFSCRQVVSYLSRCMTLYAGSIIMTGTPSGVGFGRKPPVFLKEGDSVTVEIEGIGSLTNPVAKEKV
jgi:2-keto-4-pentenoate hydratase/2-oxohepta-3-ene-1,7-dioic acid hydratase in catechol pathway